ncbi:MAG: carboxypeptidase regulatory-like domain-containing protein [Oscillospiraceae bacterium]|nr:carboxypeptidase regulatory-like domain-containing protein [Oscillospiraceae bacterium]
MAEYGLICDVEKCTGCCACFLACKDEHVGNDRGICAAPASEGQQWINIREVEYGTGDKVRLECIPLLCQHCKNPACASGAPAGAVYTRPDGIVIIDPEKAKGAKSIVKNCPYGVVFWNEALNLPQKCTLCAHMISEGAKTTRCVECCPTGALVFGDMSDKNSEISKLAARLGERLETYKPQFGTDPRVRYHALPKPFIAGEIAFEDRPGEPACGVGVSLVCKKTGKKRETVTDALGDFRFDRLPAEAVFTLSVEATGYVPAQTEVRLGPAKNLGTVILRKK